MTTCIKYIQHVFQMVITGYLDITEYSKNDIFTSEKKKKENTLDALYYLV